MPRCDFNWQIAYYLAQPKLLPKGTVIECAGHYDNSPNNPHNPDSKSDVHYGKQTWDEMLNCFMEIAMEAATSTPPDPRSRAMRRGAPAARLNPTIR